MERDNASDSGDRAADRLTVERRIDCDFGREGVVIGLAINGQRIAERGRCTECKGRLFTPREASLVLCVDCGAFAQPINDAVPPVVARRIFNEQIALFLHSPHVPAIHAEAAQLIRDSLRSRMWLHDQIPHDVHGLVVAMTGAV